MPFGPLILLFAVASFVAWVFIIIHAFGRSVGTGFLVLLVPAYLPYYAFSQFDHPKKGLIVGVFLGGGALATMIYGASIGSLPTPVQHMP